MSHLQQLTISDTMEPQDSIRRRKPRPRDDMPDILENGPALWEVYKRHGSLRQAAAEIGVSSDTVRKRLKKHGYAFKHGVGWREQVVAATVAEQQEAPQYDLRRYFSIVSFAQKQYGNEVAKLLRPCPVNCPKWLGGGEDGTDCLMGDEPCIYEDENPRG